MSKDCMGNFYFLLIQRFNKLGWYFNPLYVGALMIGFLLIQCPGVEANSDRVGKHITEMASIKSQSTTGITKSTSSKILPRTLWVWESEQLITKPKTWDDFFEFCRSNHIERIWLKVITDDKRAQSNLEQFADSVANKKKYHAWILYPKLTRQFIRRAHQQGIVIEALDGRAEYAEAKYHFIPLSVVDAIIRFNKKSKPEERYDGIHFDNEPHTLAGWEHIPTRERLLGDLIHLSVECQKRVREKSKMVFGVDVPFWWKNKDKHSGRTIDLVTYEGIRKPATYHLIDRLDNVGIMNYRDEIKGEDGGYAHAKEILEYADRVNKAEVYIGVETYFSPDTKVFFLFGLPKALFQSVEGMADKHQNDIDGYKRHSYNDGKYIHIGLEVPPDTSSQDMSRFNRALIQLAHQYDLSEYVQSNSESIQHLMKELDSDIEWLNPEIREVHDSETNGKYLGFEVTKVMPQKVTFANERISVFNRELGVAERKYMYFEKFKGIAIHYYSIYRQKLIEEGVYIPKQSIPKPSWFEKFKTFFDRNKQQSPQKRQRRLGKDIKRKYDYFVHKSSRSTISVLRPSRPREEPSLNLSLPEMQNKTSQFKTTSVTSMPAQSKSSSSSIISHGIMTVIRPQFEIETDREHDHAVVY